MIQIGDVTLPDGRIVHGRLETTYEWDTNAVNIISLHLEWQDGEELTADEYNERIGEDYLHDLVTDRLLLFGPEPEEFE